MVSGVFSDSINKGRGKYTPLRVNRCLTQTKRFLLEGEYKRAVSLNHMTRFAAMPVSGKDPLR